MIDHLSITASDLDRAQAFYDAVLGALGYPRVNRRANAIGYGVRERGPDAPPYISVYLCTGHLEPDNRHWAFRAKSRAEVRAFYAAALTHGGTDDGPPGLRPQYHPDYYGAFVRDPDGNRIEAVTHQREEGREDQQ
ncbi:MAG: VOC family protein [Alphaproteobacteria bacterium]|nr:VOC family protein [Alphaproteobacteria bacterium]MBV8411888.1 VOC family protein [Alphaproteobacteria bacterium]